MMIFGKTTLIGACLPVLLLAANANAQRTFDHDHAAAITPSGAAGDLLTEGLPFPAAPVVAIPAGAIGLVAGDEIDALSFGDDNGIRLDHVLTFSVDPAAVGVLGSGVAGEVTVDTPPGAPAAACGDLFDQTVICSNTLAPPGGGYIPGTGTGDEDNASWASPNVVGLADDLDAFDFSAPGDATGIYFSLAPGSPSLGGAGGLTAGDILYSDLVGGGVVIATLAGGIPATDVNLGIAGADLDALNVIGTTGTVANGGGVIAAGVVGPTPCSTGVVSTHLVEWSTLGFGSGSDIFVRIGATASAVLVPSASLGLPFGDNVNALEVVMHGIPAVSQWGLIVMTLLLLTAGTFVIARRRHAAA